ncbi:hypothetical protein [Alteromonas stellipolaris]|jgi:hypothetical protein|uniref:hypothetical protein n=1 Tax=Alteromonas stellipolaris TaxID=233316 RepID=UPI001D9D34A7|nr:hypothetical protein [Alteromonas stellipolaris]MBZ2163698.1 hypothetical protein [Alteromonas stellipolaris]MDO6536113.1 hypothetical protein [Alteromonas stellipolaris]MDO6628021.1 hypothetical protein [Alteromonas stellipolaris]MDP2536378.1 hypothetical protein [Alteromonas stellipolaris]
MSEKKLIEALTAACEWAKSESVGFEWLTHMGHWRRPEIIAVFETEKQKSEALAANWNQAFEDELVYVCDTLKVQIKSVRYDSEQACTSQSNGNWERHLKRRAFH